MSALHPPQSRLSLVVFTPSGYIRGTCHLPTVKSLRTFLNTGDEILKLTDVVLPGSPQVHPFLALQKSAALVIVPQDTGGAPRSDLRPIQREWRVVTCLLTLGSIRGHLELPEVLRTSDYLVRNPGFLELHDCHMGPNPYLPAEEASGDPIPLVLVNARSLVGVTEELPLAVVMGATEEAAQGL